MYYRSVQNCQTGHFSHFTANSHPGDLKHRPTCSTNPSTIDPLLPTGLQPHCVHGIRTVQRFCFSISVILLLVHTFVGLNWLSASFWLHGKNLSFIQIFSFIHSYCTGAMYFSIAVILIYGISIAMLVAASTLRRSHSDYELKSFMRSYSRLDVERRSREKQCTKAVLKRLNWPTSSSQSQSSLVAVASAAPHAAVSLSFTNNRPVKLPGLDVRAPGTSAWPDCSLPTVSVVDVSVGESYNRDRDRVLPEAVAFGTSALFHHHHHHQQQQQQKQPARVKTAPDYVRCLPRHLSERSLLVPKSNGEFDLPQHSSRRNTAL